MKTQRITQLLVTLALGLFFLVVLLTQFLENKEVLISQLLK